MTLSYWRGCGGLRKNVFSGRRSRQRDRRPLLHQESPSRSGGRCGVRDDDACDAEAEVEAEVEEPCGDASAAGDVSVPELCRVRGHRAERQST